MQTQQMCNNGRPASGTKETHVLWQSVIGVVGGTGSIDQLAVHPDTLELASSFVRKLFMRKPSETVTHIWTVA